MLNRNLVRGPLPLEIKIFLEWAGQRSLTIRTKSPLPQPYGSFWPDYVEDKHTAYGYNPSRLRPPPPSKDEIPLIDEILDLVNLIPDITQRRVLNARCLISPVNGRYLYPWTKLAIVLDKHPSTVKTIHKRGLLAIAQRIDMDKVGRFRSIVGLTHNPP